MSKLLMITGDRAFAQGKKGAFYNTLEEFHKHWERIDIICPKPNLKFKIQNLKFFDNVFIHPSPWPLIFQPFWIYREGLRILKNENLKFKIENYIMIVHEYPPFYNGIGAWMLWSKIRIPYVLEIMHIPGYPKAGTLKEWVYRNLMRIFIKMDSSKALKVRVINKKQTPEFLIQAGVPESKILYIPANYIDLDVFKPGEEQKKYDLIFVGRLVKNKGIDLLLEAAINLKFKILNFKMLIVGNGPLENDLKFKIENLKLQDTILLHGWAKDSHEVARLLRESKILIMPSYNEGGPRVVLEAMACGVPVVATAVGIVPDLAESNSLIVADWLAADIAKKINDLLGDNLLYEKYRAAGLTIVQQFKKEKAIRRYASELQQLI